MQKCPKTTIEIAAEINQALMANKRSALQFPKAPSQPQSKTIETDIRKTPEEVVNERHRRGPIEELFEVNGRETMSLLMLLAKLRMQRCSTQLLDSKIKEIGPEHVVQVVTDNASNYKAVSNLLMVQGLLCFELLVRPIV